MSDDRQSTAKPNLDFVLRTMEATLESLLQIVQEAHAIIQKAREQEKLSEDSATAQRVFGFGALLGALDTAWKNYKAGSFNPPPASPVN